MPPINEDAAALLKHSDAVRAGAVRALALLLGMVLVFGGVAWLVGG